MDVGNEDIKSAGARQGDAEVEADDWLWPPPAGKTPKEKWIVFCHLSRRDISVIKWQPGPVKCATSPVNGAGKPATHRGGDEPMMDGWAVVGSSVPSLNKECPRSSEVRKWQRSHRVTLLG